MILVQIYQLYTAKNLLSSAFELSKQLGKEVGIIYGDESSTDAQRALDVMLTDLEISKCHIEIKSDKEYILPEFCDKHDVSFLFIQLLENASRSIRTQLNRCRDLRVPYVLFKNTYEKLNIQKVMLPIGFLEEEMEKTQFASAFGRFCKSEIIMLLANDYGSKAAKNADKMKAVFDKFKLNYCLEKAKHDSFKVEMDALLIADKYQAGIIIVSASRDYGLDDIIFGPKESGLIKKSNIPILLVNPRGDLYALCD